MNVRLYPHFERLTQIIILKSWAFVKAHFVTFEDKLQLHGKMQKATIKLARNIAIFTVKKKAVKPWRCLTALVQHTAQTENRVKGA